MNHASRLINVESASIRGLSCTELSRMVRRTMRGGCEPSLRSKLLRDIGLDRRSS